MALKIEPIDKVLNDIEIWKTLIFLACMFWLAAEERFMKTGVLHGCLNGPFCQVWRRRAEQQPSLCLPAVDWVGVFVANIPVVAAMVRIVKGYFVIARVGTGIRLRGDLFRMAVMNPTPFVAMTFGSLGGNGAHLSAHQPILFAPVSALDRADR